MPVKLLRLTTVSIPIILGMLSVLTLYTTIPLDQPNRDVYVKQIIFLVSGVILLGLIMFTNLAEYFAYLPFLLISNLVGIILLSALFVAPYTVASTHRWFAIGPFTLQPSELIKPVFVISLAYILTQKINRKLIVYAVYALVYAALIFLEPDAGTTLLYILLAIVTFILWSLKYPVAKATYRSLVFLFVLSLAITLLGLKLIFAAAIVLAGWIILFFSTPDYARVYFFLATFFILLLNLIAVGVWKFNLLKPYQKQRIEPFIKAVQQRGIKGLFSAENLEPSSHIRQARIAIGSAGVKGKGPWQGTQTRLRFLPEYTTDFIYAAFSEEYGLIGAFLLIMLYLTFITGIFLLALTQTNEFRFLVISAVGTLFLAETVINIGMNLGALPTKGLPLPFLSYGGSAMLTNFVLTGLVVKYSRLA